MISLVHFIENTKYISVHIISHTYMHDTKIDMKIDTNSLKSEDQI